MTKILTPSSEDDIAQAVREAAATAEPLEIEGGGTRRGLGRPINAVATLSLAGHSGITLYEPGALTLVAKSGTPLADVEAALKAEGQRLPFDPMDHRPVYGSTGTPTIGGTVAINNSGPRRIQAGACRDSLIGVRFVDGSGEVIKNGGRVMKNVTGLDLVKLMCGSHGTLGVLTEVAFKVLPANAREASLVFKGQSVAEAVATLSSALSSPFEVSGAAHTGGDGGTTVLRVEGFAGQVDYKLDQLQKRLTAGAEVLEGDAHLALWRRIRDVEDFAGDTAPLWRISVKPGDAPEVAEQLRQSLGARIALDWGGGLIWAALPETAEAAATSVRGIVAGSGGYATLVRADDATRAAQPVFQPQHPRLAKLSADIRAKFDPAGILNRGKMAV